VSACRAGRRGPLWCAGTPIHPSTGLKRSGPPISRRSVCALLDEARSDPRSLPGAHDESGVITWPSRVAISGPNAAPEAGAGEEAPASSSWPERTGARQRTGIDRETHRRGLGFPPRLARRSLCYPRRWPLSFHPLPACDATAPR
jgi:hypothetical protein